MFLGAFGTVPSMPFSEEWREKCFELNSLLNKRAVNSRVVLTSPFQQGAQSLLVNFVNWLSEVDYVQNEARFSLAIWIDCSSKEALIASCREIIGVRTSAKASDEACLQDVIGLAQDSCTLTILDGLVDDDALAQAALFNKALTIWVCTLPLLPTGLVPDMNLSSMEGRKAVEHFFRGCPRTPDEERAVEEIVRRLTSLKALEVVKEYCQIFQCSIIDAEACLDQIFA